jgi:hypothetical protein
MATNRVLGWAAICLLTATSAARAQTNLDALKVVPASADGFVIIAKLSDLDKKASVLAQRLNVPAVSIFEFAKQMAGVGDGINRNGSAVLIAFAPMGETPVAVVAIPVSKFDAVAKSVGAGDAVDGIHSFQLAGGIDAVMAKKGNFALVAQADQREHLIKTLKSEQNILDKAKSIERWIAAQDVAAVVLESAVKGLAKKVFESIPEEVPGLPEDQAKAIKVQVDWARGMAKAASEELTHLALGATMDLEQNVHLTFQVGFVKGGGFSKANSDQPKESPLTGLPSGPYIIAFGSAFRPESMQKLMSVNVELSKTAYNLSDVDAKELEMAMASTVQGLRAMSVGFQSPGEKTSFVDGVVGVLRVDNSKEYLKSYREAVDKSNTILKLDSRALPVKVGRFDGVETVVDMTSIAKIKDDPNARKMLEKIFGAADEVTTTVVAVNATTVLLGYFPADKMKSLAEGYAKRPMLTAAPLVAKTLKLFPKNAFMVTLVSPKGVVDLVAKVAKDLGHELPIPVVGETPPVGMAASSDTTSFQFRVVMPAEVFAEIGRVVQGLKSP